MIESRGARTDEEQARRLASLERLGLALTDMAALLQRGARADARLVQARARLLWVTSDTEVADDVRHVVVTRIDSSNESEIAERVETALEVLLTGLEDYRSLPS